MVEKKTSFLLKDLDYQWWKQVKILALKQDKTLRDFVLTCIEYSVKNPFKED